MRIKFILLICMAMIISGCALNRDVRYLDQRVSKLETENASLQKKIDQLKADIESQGTVANNIRDMYAGQGASFDQCKEEIRTINGRFDETEHHVNQAISGLTDSLQLTESKIDHYSQTISDNKNRITRLENFVGFELGGQSAAKDNKTPANHEKLSEDELYQVSKQAYDRADYETARQGFEKFLEIYPKSDKADNARFWIGEIYFNEQWYQKAIVEYQKVIDTYPKGNKVPSAYLKEGISFHKLGEDVNAVQVFKTLIEKFPDSNEAKIARKTVSQIK